MGVGLSQLRALVAVVEEGSFSGAATRLGVSQSAVSHAVAGLEQAAGRPVLTRSSPPTPTMLGAEILAHARSGLAAVRAVDELAARRDGLPRGHIVLAAPPTACHDLVPALLVQWAADCPEVSVSLFEARTTRWAAGLKREWRTSPWLSTRPDPGGVVLHVDHFHAALASDHPLAGQDAISVADLADDPFLLSTGVAKAPSDGSTPRQVQRLSPLTGSASSAPCSRWSAPAPGSPWFPVSPRPWPGREWCWSR